MKIKNNFVLQQIVDEYIVVPVGEAADNLHGVIKLNETGASLWNLMDEHDQTKQSLVEYICKTYDIKKDFAEKDVDKFLKQLNEMGCIVNE